VDHPVTPYHLDETHDAPAAGEDRLTWTPRPDGDHDVYADLELPRNASEGAVEVGAVTLSGGQIRVRMWMRSDRGALVAAPILRSQSGIQQP